MNAQTIAQTISSMFGNDGMNFSADDGRDFDEVCCSYHAEKSRGRCWYDADGAMTADYDPDGDMVRYEFSDGSAIVISGDAWDIEGETPFSWASA